MGKDKEFEGRLNEMKSKLVPTIYELAKKHKIVIANFSEENDSTDAKDGSLGKVESYTLEIKFRKPTEDEFK